MEEGGERLESPWTPWARPGPPTDCHGEHYFSLGTHLFQALHVLEVEANVEEAQVGIDKLELREAGGHSLCRPVPQESSLCPTC